MTEIDLTEEMSQELKHLVLSWIDRLDLLLVPENDAVSMMLSVLDAGMQSIVQVCKQIMREIEA